MEDITEGLWGTRVSPSTVSNLNKKIYAKIEAWRNRRIDRGLNGVRLIIFGCLPRAHGECGGVSTQGTLPTLHFYHNVFSHVLISLVTDFAVGYAQILSMGQVDVLSRLGSFQEKASQVLGRMSQPWNSQWNLSPSQIRGIEQLG